MYSSRFSLSVSALVASLGLVAGANAQVAPRAAGGIAEHREPKEVRGTVVSMDTMRVVYPGHSRAGQGAPTTVLRGPGCPDITDSVANNFSQVDLSGEMTLQLGMIADEGFASTYTVSDPNPGTPQNEAFPIEVVQVAFFVGTPAAGIGPNITMGYRIEVWDGEPGQAGSSIAFSVTSDPDIASGLPPDASLQRVPGTTCDDNDILIASLTGQPVPASVLQVQFSVDQTADPVDRMLVNGVSGTGKVSIVVYMDRPHQPGTGCSSLSFCNNAFMTTEGLSINGQSNGTSPTYLTRNWLYAVPCAGGCPAGFSRFSQLSTGLGGCRPSRDVLQQVIYRTSTCAPIVQGACCAAGGGCSVSTQAACGGTYQGDNSTCTPNPCPQPMGRCCNTLNGQCTNTTQANCVGGTWTQGLNCTANPCPEPSGACCTTGGGCAVVLQSACGTFGGSFIGGGVACGPGSTCPLGACCLPNGSCQANISQPACAALSGAFQGVGATCGQVSCPQPTGACCASSGACVPDVLADTCTVFGGTWQGAFTTCSPDPCAPPLGACCDGAACATGVTDANCAGTWSAGNSCAITPGPPHNFCCPGNFDRDGDKDVADIFAGLGAYFASDDAIDWNGVGGVTLGDFFLFFGDWFTPC